MTVYEFYARDEEKGNKLIGILPERRVNQERINNEAIMNWAKVVFENIFNLKDVFYTKITLDQNGFGNFYSKEHQK